MSNTNYTNQHFLTNPEIAEAMVSIADVNSDDYVLEIGPGKGMITRPLLKNAGRVVVIEKDLQMYEFLIKLKEEFPSLEIIMGDSLKRRWPRKVSKLVANIPFNITEPLIYKLIQENIRSSCLIVGEKYAETANLYKFEREEESTPSRLALLTNAYFIPEIQMEVPSNQFSPEPSVNGAIITLESIKKTALAKMNFSLYILRSIWDQNTRRVYDSLFNGIANFLSANGEVCYLSPDQVYKFMELDSNILEKRGSSLDNQDFFKIYTLLKEKRIKKRLFRNNKHLEENLESAYLEKPNQSLERNTSPRRIENYPLAGIFNRTGFKI